MLAFIDHEKARGAIPSSGASGISRHGGVLAHSMVSARRVTSSYSFQNAFFYLQFPDDPSESKSAPRALKKTRRKAKFNPQKQVRLNTHLVNGKYSIILQTFLISEVQVHLHSA